MDKFTKNYIDDIVKPMLHRIEYLERSNEELKVHVKYLESLIIVDKTYQKPTVSAANHMRDSRISSKADSSRERPTWNSKTKIEQSPAAVNKQKEAAHYEKIKTKPPIPKTMKSPNKNDLHEDMRASGSDKRIPASTKVEPSCRQSKVAGEGPYQISPKKGEVSVGGIKEIGEKQVDVASFNNKFQQLVKNNTEILTSMKQNSQETKDAPKPALAANNYVQKVVAPKSEYNQSQSTSSPNERSFVSDHPEKVLAKPSEGLKVTQDCNMASVQLK